MKIRKAIPAICSAISIIISIGSFIYSLFADGEPFIKATIISVLFFLLSYGLWVYSLMNEKLSEMLQKITENNNKADVDKHGDGMVLLKSLTNELSEIQQVSNVRIVPENATYEPTEWNKSIEKAVESGVYFIDVVSEKGCESADRIHENLKDKKIKGRYCSYKIDSSLPSYLNFKIIIYKNGTRRVCVGWRLSNSAHSNLNEPCFSSCDELVVTMFEKWFADMAHGDADLDTRRRQKA